MSEVRDLSEVVVVGSTFGAVHAAAVARSPHLRLAGIAGRGSARTAELAHAHGVEQFDTNAPPPTVPGAAPALTSVVLRSSILGGAGGTVALDLLAAGRHVLLEQPVRADEIAALAAAARAGGAALRIGNLYLQLPAVRAFLRAAEALRERTHVLSVQVSCGTQVLLPAAAVLRRAAGAGVVSVGTTAEAGPFTVAVGAIGRTPFTLRVHNEHDPDDPDDHALLLIDAELTTADGTLRLLDPAGPLLWCPRLRLGTGAPPPADGLPADGLPADDGIDRVVELVPRASGSLGAWVRDAWLSAIETDLLALRADVEAGGVQLEHINAAIADARAWTALSGAIGLPRSAPRGSGDAIDADWLARVLGDC